MPSLIYLSSVACTNDFVLKLASPKSQDFKGVYTFEQTEGRGQYGNQWKMLPDRNIAYSFIFPCDLVTLSQPMFNFYTALIISNFLAKITDKEVKIKWPNDIVLNDRKIVGILLEKKKVNGKWFYIVGCGLNVLQERFPDYSHASSLKVECHREFNLHSLAENLHTYFQQQLLKNISNEEVLEKINAKLFRKDKISVFEIENNRRNGMIRYVDTEGFLYVELENIPELQRFYHKEIKLLY